MASKTNLMKMKPDVPQRPNLLKKNLINPKSESSPKKLTRVHDLAKQFENRSKIAPPIPKKPILISCARKNSLSFLKPTTARFYCRSVARKRSSLAKKYRSTGDLIVKTGLRRRMSKSKSFQDFNDDKNSRTSEVFVDKKNVTIVQILSMTQGSNYDRPVQAPPKPPPKPPSKIMIAKSLRQLRPVSPVESEHNHDQPSTSNERLIDIGDLESKNSPSLTRNWLRSKSSIRKPSSRPPPPPISPKPNFKFTWQLRQSTSASNIYQSMSSPEEEENISIWSQEIQPKVPSIPPPKPPKSARAESEEMYEDIDVGFNPIYAPSSCGSELDPKSMPYSPKYQKRSQQNRHHSTRNESKNYNTNSEDEDPMQRSMFSQSIGESKMINVNADRKSHFGTWNARKNQRVRPSSHAPLEFEKLMRIKSEIQLNLSRKMDKIKSKVVHSPAILKPNRTSFSGIFVSPANLQTDCPNPPSTSKIPTDACLYGDDWSSESEFDEEPVYGGSSAAASSGSSNYAIGKSKSASHASQFWKSIDSAFTLGRKNRENRIDNIVLKNVTSVDSREKQKNSLLDEIESEYMQTDFFRKKITSPEMESTSPAPIQRPTEPPPPPMPACPPPPLVTSTSNSKFDHSLDSDEEDEEDDELDLSTAQEVLAESELVEEDALDDEDDDIPSDAAELQKKQTYTSRLPEPQPLYQIYMLHEQGKILEGNSATTSGASSASGDSVKHDEVDSVCESTGIEDALSLIRRQSSSVSTDSGRGADTSSHLTSNTSMRRERLTAASIYGSQRSLWCELPEVKSAGLLDTLDENTKKLQEAFFEVITSEASYLRSINVLITHFMASPEFLISGPKPGILTAAERKHLFSNIIAVRDCSERLLCDLENRLEENLILTDVCDILCEHFESNFEAYVKYCSNQVYQDRTLKRLKMMNSQFVSCVTKIESDRQCHGLDMRSFLMLPMQRITRYPLLVYAILERVPSETLIQKSAAKALMLANQVVRNCNEGARRMERTEQLLDIEQRLVYKKADLKRVPLVTSGRYVVKNGQVTEVYERRSKGLLQSKQKTRNLYIFLFSDLLLIAKKRLNGTFVCKDYAQRRFVVVEPVESHSHKVPPGALHILTSKPHLFVCVLLQNANGKQIEFLFNVESESDRERWLSALRPPTCSNPDEKIYAEWDCPQAVAVHAYTANQEDELELEPGDLVNVLRKMPDGWFYGERARDGKGGWFPSSYVQQVLNDHVRANNYKQRLKVIEAAAVYRAQQTQKSGSVDYPSSPTTPTAINPGANTPLMDRLRRLSNPRGFFINL